ncbi:DUF2628 domain-containing protein [Rhizobium deserti]|uniref:DUF2628 domain-containing protein n=1 Tax=Rhizobium deserti TaxID=2547961 RepID=A0A4R5U7S2_9HYPH|nr:DUF2628 domain-containing protein [Rhizobium deserti]TDK30416.1 DUF2628 domain-containing protein [Rhizobium deserti]
MRSYAILTPPGGPLPDHRSTLVIADRFSWLAFLFPWLWLFWHKLWLAGIVALLVQIGSGFLMQIPGFAPAGLLIGLAVSLLAGLESRNYYSNALGRRGWTVEAIVFAQDRQTAEEIYFSSLPQPEKQPMPLSSDWAPQGKQPSDGWRGQAPGLFDYGVR